MKRGVSRVKSFKMLLADSESQILAMKKFFVHNARSLGRDRERRPLLRIIAGRFATRTSARVRHKRSLCSQTVMQQGRQRA